jgi:pimeloyl-ACP methyl ester carboxylesterase
MSLLNSFVFPYVKPTYDKNTPYLQFLLRDDGYHIPIKHFIKDSHKPTLLMSHGNRSDIGLCPIDLADRFNCNILIWDYAGYGLHTKRTASAQDCEKDIVTIYHYLKQKNIDDMIIYGYSLGTGPSCYLAHYLCRHDIKTKLILVAAFKSVMSVMFNASLPGDFFKNDCLASKMTCPVLMIHGCQDTFTFYGHAVQLSHLFPQCTFIPIHGCGHHTINKHPIHDTMIQKFIGCHL